MFYPFLLLNSRGPVKKVPSGYPGRVNFLAGPVTFKAYLPEQVLQYCVVFSFGRILNSNHVWVIY